MAKIYELDPLTLTLDQRLSALVDVEREIARLHARSASLVAVIVDDPCDNTPAPLLEKEYVREELRTVLRESAVSISSRIEFAREMTHRMPTTLRALEQGELTARHARLLVDAVAGLPDADVTAVEAACVPFARGRDTGAFARKVRREILALDSRTVEQRTEAALADRRVWVSPNCDSATATVGAVLPADGAQLLITALDIAAEGSGPGDPRTKDQRRADALVQLGIDALDGFRGSSICRDVVVRDDNTEANGSTAPQWHGARPTVQVVVALSTLLGMDEQPAELSGHGAIPAELARRIAADESGTWRRLVTDDVGHLVDHGRTRYRPPADLREYVLARDRTCRFPSCHRAARLCEVDHVVAWAEGGCTKAGNLVALCRRHHHLKHDTDWTIVAREDGSCTWTSPTGRRHRVDLIPYPIDATISDMTTIVAAARM